MGLVLTVRVRHGVRYGVSVRIRVGHGVSVRRHLRFITVITNLGEPFVGLGL